MAIKILLVMLGGAVGTLARYGTSLLAAHWLGKAFPWGTLIVNLVGCLLIGVCFGLAARFAWFSPPWRLLLVTGFMGGLTTFSSFAVETVVNAQDGNWRVAVLNFLANNVGGLLLVVAGMKLVAAR